MKGPSLLEWIPEFHLDGPLPSRSIPRGRSYSSVVFDPSTTLVVAASSLQARFASFDEDGNRLWEPDGEFKRITSCWSTVLTMSLHATLVPNVSDPVCDCSTLELIDPDLWVAMDGCAPWIAGSGISLLTLTVTFRFEFATNEFVNDVTIVSLETSSTETGSKDFLAVGTTINRGEDLAAKGAVSIFDMPLGGFLIEFPFFSFLRHISSR